MNTLFLEHKVSGVSRISQILEWQTHLVPVQTKNIIAADTRQGVGLGITLIAIVALRDVANKRFVPTVVNVDESCSVVSLENPTPEIHLCYAK